MQILIAPLESFVLAEKTEFSADEAVGQTELSVKNAKGFSANDYVILGTLGSSECELVQISSVASDLKSITLKSATKHTHKEDEPITQILYNQRKFYRATSESGTYSHLSGEGSPVDIKVDNPEGTLLEDTTGTSSSWYKATYYNSTTGAETSLDDATAVKASDTEHYVSIYQIKKQAGLEDNWAISDELVAEIRDEAENEAEGRVANVYSLPFSTKPKIFRHIVKLLAASKLLSREYGVESDVDISKTGESMREQAERLLTQISDGTLVLLDDDGNALSKTTLFTSSGSNDYSKDKSDIGEWFNLSDEPLIKAKDPDNPRS